MLCYSLAVAPPISLSLLRSLCALHTFLHTFMEVLVSFMGYAYNLYYITMDALVQSHNSEFEVPILWEKVLRLCELQQGR